MAKLKRKTRSVIKNHDGETYVFRNGVAIVPSCQFQGKPMTITLKEFEELSKEKKKAKGEKHGLCNRSACLSPNNVVYFNHSTEKYYCPSCANMINDANHDESMKIFGHDLCIEEK